MVKKVLMILGAALVILVGGTWLGLQVASNRFDSIPAGHAPDTVPIPAGLPAPVERFARVVYGDAIPVVESAVVIGRARLAPTGLPMPARFRFYYDARRSSHYHEIEVTWFKLPLMRIHERNLEGHATLDLSLFGKVDDQPHTNRAGIQGYWSEVLAWVPAITLTDPRVTWEPFDDNTARLILPELDPVEALTVIFDPESGLLDRIDTMRYQSEENPDRLGWHNRAFNWQLLNGTVVPLTSTTQWGDAAPWATWEIDDVSLNVEVSERFAAFG
ncbi:MAG: hypothetical protein J5J04_09340 [Anaerolineae bacterium]|nr:hypothetical protein [Chloroflexota bacterium]MBV6434844.1 hypothetical protein [Anaerolineae bacterium]MDL1914330.1 hypothetical protein [Anaerolineae bacterium CFX4]OQY83833.1 MAG: hypothetical protein B6D42_06695 [Anaerolineae bacterium UTCFX5]MCO6444272.1 hypothetical protein [Anaerolineae bacterium]